MDIIYHEDNPLNGIIKYLYDNNKSLYDSIIIDASVVLSNQSPKSTIDFNPSTYWIGGLNDPSTIIYFIPIPIKIKGYVIQTSNVVSSPDPICFPKAWNFSVSYDGKKFIHLDQFYDENEELKGNLISKYIKYSYKGAYQYFKIEIVDSYCPQTKNFDINQFELFGSIMFAQNDAITCNSNIIISKIIYTIIFIMK